MQEHQIMPSEQPFSMTVNPVEVFSMVNSPDISPGDLLYIGTNVGRPIAYREGSNMLRNDLTIANYDPLTMHEQPEIVISHFKLPFPRITRLHFTPSYRGIGTKLQELRTVALEAGVNSTEHQAYFEVFLKEVATRLESSSPQLSLL